MGGFGNPVAGGNMLVRPALQSPNYVSGKTGWKIGRDGSAEFNTGTFRNGEVVSATELFYNGTPALGNLVASIAPAQGVDDFGNTYYQGVCTYSTANTFTQLVGSNFFSGRMGDLISNVASAGYTVLNTTERGSTPAALLRPPTNGAHTYRGCTVVTPGDDGTQANGARVYVVELNGGAAVYGGISGAWFKTDNAGNALTWQVPGQPGMPVLGTGWAAGPSGGTVQAVQYRIDAEDNLVIVGAVHTTSTTPAATVFTLPTGYRPLVTQRVPGVSNSGGTPTVRYIEVNSSGAVSVNNAIATASTDVYFSVRVPLGNLA